MQKILTLFFFWVLLGSVAMGQQGKVILKSAVNDSLKKPQKLKQQAVTKSDSGSIQQGQAKAGVAIPQNSQGADTSADRTRLQKKGSGETQGGTLKPQNPQNSEAAEANADSTKLQKKALSETQGGALKLQNPKNSEAAEASTDSTKLQKKEVREIKGGAVLSNQQKSQTFDTTAHREKLKEKGKSGSKGVVKPLKAKEK